MPVDFALHLVLNITVVAEKYAAKEAHEQLSNREKYFHSDNVLNIKKDHWTQLTKWNAQINYSKQAINIAYREEARIQNV